ncbi:MAG: DEAD/DEAH box helicase [Firmicutes bacterium]|nr:DEAD/DEAH box helicase [Bacillota bacterium]
MIFKPHPYQAYCIRRIVEDTAVGLYLDMGLGKTVITLTAIAELKLNRFRICKALIVAPKKVAEATWQTEARKWDHLQGLRVATILGTARQRKAAALSAADVYVVNRDNVAWLVELFGNAWPFDMVVLDESTSFKNRQTARFKHLAWVRPHIRRLVELTGTPAPNGLLDLWAQIWLLDGGERLGRFISHYRERYFEPDKRNAQQIFSWRPKPFAEDAIREKISDICVTMKAEDYISLPDLVYDDIPVALDEAGKKVYKQMERERLLEVADHEIDAQTAAVLSNKLLQLCNGAVYDGSGQVVEIHRCKIEAFLELLEALNGQPVLVFYQFRHDLNRLEAALAGTGLRVRRLDGGEAAAAWNARSVDVLLAHPASAAYGLNLQEGGNHVIWFGLNWSLELYSQANARLHRQGQTQKVIVHHLIVQGGRDEDVAAALRDKDDTQQRLMESLKARIAEAEGLKKLEEGAL